MPVLTRPLLRQMPRSQTGRPPVPNYAMMAEKASNLITSRKDTGRCCRVKARHWPRDRRDLRPYRCSNFLPVSHSHTGDAIASIAALMSPLRGRWHNRPDYPEFSPLHSGLKLAPALAYGNAAVMKPAELTPACAWELAKILDEAGCPKGCLIW